MLNMWKIISYVYIVSSNPVHGEVYSIQHYVIKFVSDLRHCRWFSPGTPVSSTNKTNRHDINEIVLKVTLNTINQTKPYIYKWCSFRIIHFITVYNTSPYYTHTAKRIKTKTPFSYKRHPGMRGYARVLNIRHFKIILFK